MDHNDNFGNAPRNHISQIKQDIVNGCYKFCPKHRFWRQHSVCVCVHVCVCVIGFITHVQRTRCQVLPGTVQCFGTKRTDGTAFCWRSGELGHLYKGSRKRSTNKPQSGFTSSQYGRGSVCLCIYMNVFVSARKKLWNSITSRKLNELLASFRSTVWILDVRQQMSECIFMLFALFITRLWKYFSVERNFLKTVQFLAIDRKSVV